MKTDHSWVANALSCSQQRFKRLLYETKTSIVIDRGEKGKQFWALLDREKDTARKLNDLLFNYNLYENYDY
jgi:hypothetical protein